MGRSAPRYLLRVQDYKKVKFPCAVQCTIALKRLRACSLFSVALRRSLSLKADDFA